MRQVRFCLWTILVILVFLYGCSKPATDHLLLAEEFLLNQQYDQAVFEFYEYMIINPDDPRAYQGSAESYLAMGETEKAIEQYELMIKNFPTNPDGYRALALLLDKQSIISLYTNFIKETSEESTGYLLLAEYLKQVGDTQAAIDVYMDILSKFPSLPDGYIEVGLYYFDSYRYPTAIAILQDGLIFTDDPRVIETYNYIASYIVVEWQDPYIEKVIRNYLDKPYGAITLDTLSEIYSIEINGSKEIHRGSDISRLGIIEINGVEQPPVTDQLAVLDDFSNFISLEHLKIRQFPIEYISSFGSMPNLHTLDISSTNIESISFVGNFGNLTSLTLNDNRITSLISLSDSVNIEFLSLTDNYLVDVSPLAGLPKLKTLILSNNRIIDIEPIIGVHDFVLIDLTGNKLKDISQIELIVATEILY
ncbi:MAG: tetratricopeptide repeat protein [Oscillospiraceae bacterium]|nr:tetratricopeptide repeat protein [Oscillospiraceae bacterium]